jgi:hypothetical protein
VTVTVNDEASRHYVVVDSFFADARPLRAALDRRFGPRVDPFDPSRFVWEHWDVPGQFRQHRAPARNVFPAAVLGPFEARLLAWAALTLGLSAFGGPPWVSSLVDGCFQVLHRDSPNGDWAFSFGLTRPGRARFRGGETLLARPELLDYWRRGQHKATHADTPLFDEVPSRFNRIVAFDSRVPHAVRTIEGPRDLRDGRVAIQGWLRANGCVVDPRLGVDVDAATDAVNGPLRGARAKGVEGLFTLRLDVARDGRVRRATPIVDTLVATGRDEGAAEKARRDVAARIARARLPPPSRAGIAVAPVLVGEGKARVPARA